MRPRILSMVVGCTALTAVASGCVVRGRASTPTIHAQVGVDADPVYVEARLGDVRDSQADIEAARDAFGYEPAVGLREGLRRTIEWLRVGRRLQSA